LGAPERAVIGRDGKARAAAVARAMARIRNAASVVEGRSIGCAAPSPDGWGRSWPASPDPTNTCSRKKAVNCRI